jgi:hypothetical protein
MLRRLVVFSALAFAAHAHAAEAGKVLFAAGSVQIADRAGAEGAVVQEGELLTTGDDGFLYIKTADNGLFILRPKTRARIAAYHIDKANPANTRVKLELLSGVARSKSGEAVKLARQNFRFNTPVAAIGVRGTDFTVYTDQDTSRVAVLTGGVVVSGFAGACRPEGGGPCEGAASRELSATQRGQLLQVKRGQQAPQLLQGGANAPDLVSPPRADEPVAKSGGVATEPTLDPRKSNSLEKIVASTPVPPPPVVIPPPSEVVTPVPVPTPTPTPDPTPAPTPTPEPPPVVVVVPPVVEPQLPEREIQWGRWTSLMDQAPTTPLKGPDGAERIIGGNFVLFRTAGKDYVLPERGSVGFVLKNSEAYILNDDPAVAAVAAQVRNGQLNVDFGKASFVTSFDLVGGGETFKMMADGDISSEGRFGNGDSYKRPFSNNMNVNGVLSNAGNGSAAYIFQGRLDATRTTNGVTSWSH